MTEDQKKSIDEIVNRYYVAIVDWLAEACIVARTAPNFVWLANGHIAMRFSDGVARSIVGMACGDELAEKALATEVGACWSSSGKEVSFAAFTETLDSAKHADSPLSVWRFMADRSLNLGYCNYGLVAISANYFSEICETWEPTVISTAGGMAPIFYWNSDGDIVAFQMPCRQTKWVQELQEEIAEFLILLPLGQRITKFESLYSQQPTQGETK